MDNPETSNAGRVKGRRQHAMEAEILERFTEAGRVIESTGQHLAGRLVEAARLLVEALRAGKGVYLFGNGGSAADAQHVAGELVGRFLLDRRAFKAQALSTDGSVLTCLANDFGFEYVFSRQLEAQAGEGDVAVAFSTSGRSANVVRGLETARRLGMKTLLFCGVDGGSCAAFADVLCDVPSRTTARVQEAHMVLYHCLCEFVERGLAGG